MNEQKELAEIKHLKNEAMSNHINRKLMKNDHKIHYIQN